MKKLVIYYFKIFCLNRKNKIIRSYHYFFTKVSFRYWMHQ